MAQNQKVLSTLIALCAVLAASVCVACSDKKSVTTNVPAPAPANTSSSSSAPVVPPGAAEDVNKKGTSTGMVGGEAGTVASSGKPGTGTESGAGTGAAQGSDSKTTDKK